MLNIGIIGFGRIGKVHARSIQTRVEDACVLRVCDPFMNPEMEAEARKLEIMECGRDTEELIQDPRLDAVLICSSTHTHAALSMEAAKAGKHIFCEKPIDPDPKRIVEVITAVKQAGVHFQVGFNRRFDHNFKALRQAVEQGRIGDPHFITVVSRDPEAPSLDYVKVSGGMLMDMTIHDFDMVRYLSGSEVTEVYAAGAALVNPRIQELGDIDSAQITLRFENGAIGCISNSRRAAYGYDQRAEVFGSKGSAATQNDTASTLILSDEQGIQSEKPLYFFLERYMQSFAEEIISFTQAIQENKPTAVGGADGLIPVLMAKAAEKSMREHRPVTIAEIKQEEGIEDVES